MTDKGKCQWTNCEAEAEGKRTDGTFVKWLCARHLRLTSRKPS